LINKRTPKLTGFAIYETNSIGTNTKAKKKEVFVGKNSENVLNPYFSIVMTFIPIKTENDKVNVTNKWLVDVKEYGISPIKLLNKIKLKINEINGKYLVLSVVIMSVINWATISEIDSITFCHEFDT
jgi:hypothetical protein